MQTQGLSQFICNGRRKIQGLPKFAEGRDTVIKGDSRLNRASKRFFFLSFFLFFTEI